MSILSPAASHTVNEITFFYCLSTCVFLTLLALGLFLSETYLLFGEPSIYPIFVFLSVLELIKSIYSQALQQRDSSVYPNKKFSVLTVLLNHIKTVKIKEFIRSTVTICGSILVYYVLAVLFGALVLVDFETTFLFSALLSQLTIFPLCLNFGTSSVLHLLSGIKPTSALHSLLIMNIQGTLLGAWLGAIVIPLDWDRPWQVWPIPCSTGAFCGYILSHYVGLIQRTLSPSLKFQIPRKRQ